MENNDFLVPDELGWECNNEISTLIDEIMQRFEDKTNDLPFHEKVTVWHVTKAELMDNIYAVIRKYQNK